MFYKTNHENKIQVIRSETKIKALGFLEIHDNDHHGTILEVVYKHEVHN